MARPKSKIRRQSIINGAIRLISREGLGAATAAIAKEAKTPNGSFFTYFPTKSDLFNTLYREIKEESIACTVDGLAEAGGDRDQLMHMWTRWTTWGAHHPEKRRVLALLTVSDEILESTRTTVGKGAHLVVNLVMRVAKGGSLKNQDLAVVGAIVESFATTTMDLMIRDPKHANQICRTTFEMLWKALR